MRGAKVGGGLLAVAMLVAACSDDGAANKAGGSGAPATLRIGTDDVPGRPAADQIEEFVRQVDDRSGGLLRIEPVWQAVGAGVDDWDQAVARMVVDGELDMGMIPARAWDTEGVTTLRALHAPFLVTSDELVEEIVMGDLADEMLAGLDQAGVTGLALLPEGLRRVFAFGEPLVAPADFVGATIRAPSSDTTYALFEALGATPDDLNGRPFEDAVAAGSVAAVETSFRLVRERTRPAPGTATGNVTLFPKVNSLVVNTEAFDDLTDGQREMLRDAAAATLQWAVTSAPSDADLAQEFCAGGGRIVAATEADLAAFEQAVQPVYDQLEQDEATAGLIERMRELKESAPEPAAVRSCEPRSAPPHASAEADAPGGSTFPEGIVRTEMSAEILRNRGVPPTDASVYDGIVTVTHEDGRWSIIIEGPEEIRCTGTYTLESGRITYVMTPACRDIPDGTVLFSAAWTVKDGMQVLSDFRTADGKPDPIDEAIWAGWEWQKIG